MQRFLRGIAEASGLALVCLGREAGTALDGTGFARIRGQARSHRGAGFTALSKTVLFQGEQAFQSCSSTHCRAPAASSGISSG